MRATAVNLMQKQHKMSNINANATVTLTVNGKQAQSMLDDLKKKSVDLEKAIDGAARRGDKASLKKLQKELKQTKNQISQIESATVGVEKVMRNLDKATPKELNKTLQTLKKQLNGIERGTKEWDRQCDAIKRVRAEIDRVNADLREGESRWSRMNRIINDWQTTIMGAAAAVTGLVMAGRSAVKAYAEMDAEMANVRKFTGMTAEQVEDLNEEFKKIDTRTSREDLNKLAEEAGRLGKSSKEDVLGFVRAADQINVALDDLGEGATLTLSKLTNIFGDEARLGTEQALLAVGSVINELSQNCTASAPYLAQFAQRLAGVGAQAKMTIPQIMGFAAVLDSQGQAVEMSATALSVLITDLFKKQDQIIKATGMNAEKFKETLKRSTNEGLVMLLQRLHELGNIDVLAPVFKEMGENGSRAAGVLAALAGNIDKVVWEQQEANKAYEEATSVTGEFNVQNNTVQAGLDKAVKRVRELAIELGQQLAPVMRHVISSTTIIMKMMSTTIGFISRNKAEIAAVSVVIAAYAVAVNLAAIKTKIATAAQLLHNAAIKAGNVLLPIAQVLLNGLKLSYERIVWQTRGATATQQAFNKSLVALRTNAIAAKLAMAGIAVAVAAAVVALIRYVKAQQTEAQVQRMLNGIQKQATEQAAEQKSKIEALLLVAQNELASLKDRQTAINALNKIIPNYNAQLDATTGKYSANKKALDDYIGSLVRMYEVMGAKEKLAELGKQKAEAKVALDEANKQLNEAKNAGSGYSYTTSWGSVGNTSQDLVSNRQMKVNSAQAKYSQIETMEKAIINSYGGDIAKEAAKEAQQQEVTAPSAAGTGTTYTKSGKTNHTNTGKTEDKLKAEKEWKAKEEALNRIAYATGEKNEEQYQQRILDIEMEYQQKVLQHQDLTEQERLEAQATFAEAKKKVADNANKKSVEDEQVYYNELVAAEKQRYIDGKVSAEVYEDTIAMMELQHLTRLKDIYKEGSKERLQVEQELQDKLVADQKKRQKAAEEAEKKHQENLKKIKAEYFGDNLQERTTQYNADLTALNEIYKSEIAAAGDNAREKLRIEEAFLKAKKALREKYNLDDLDANKNFLELWNEDMQEWLESDMGKAVMGSVDLLTSSMGSIFQQLTSMVQSEAEMQIAAIEKRYDAEIANAEGNNYKVKKLEKEKAAEEAKIKKEANRKSFSMQVIQAVAQTATAALNAYSSAAAVPLVGYILAPIAASMAVAAGMMQVAAIKKQQQASEAQGYAEGGFTGKGGKYEPAGVVHKGEWVASQELVNSPVARPMIDALDYAQRNNTIGALRGSDVSRSISPMGGQVQTVVVQQAPAAQAEIAAVAEYANVMRQLKQRLQEPFVTVNTVTGDTGIKQAQDEYTKLMRNKTPKSRRKN